MKKLLLSVSLLAVSLVASAQVSFTFNEAWSGARLSYVPTTLDYDGGSDTDFKGLSLEYFKGFGIIEDMPVFLEVGAGLEWLNWNDETDKFDATIDGKDYEYSYKSALNIVSLDVPVNVGYKFALQDNITIMPYIGLKARFNMIAKQASWIKGKDYAKAREEEMEKYLGSDWKDKYEQLYGEEYKDPSKRDGVNMFDEDKVGKQTLKRFLLGWQIGATATYNQYSLSISYGSCFTDEIINGIDDCSFGGTTISVGYTF